MGFIIFVIVIIVLVYAVKEKLEQQKHEDAILDEEFRKKMREQSAKIREHQLNQEKRHVMDSEYHDAVKIAEQFRKEAELVLFERKCMKSSKNIKFNCKTFLELKNEKIDGVDYYKKIWEDEYDSLIRDIDDNKYIDIHNEVKDFVVDVIKNEILSSLRETQFGNKMIGKALDIDMIYGQLCIIIGATNTDKYNILLNQIDDYLDAIFSKGFVFIKQIEYGKFENPLDEPNEMLYIQDNEMKIKQEIQENILHITDNDNDDFIGMLRVFNLDFLKKMASLMWYYAKKKTFDSDSFYESCSFFDEYTATNQHIAERVIAEIYAKNQMGGIELVRQDIDKYNNIIIKGRAFYQKDIVSALAWMELYDLELIVLKNIVNAKGTLTDSMQERLIFLSDGGTYNIKFYDIKSVNNWLYYDSSSCTWTPKEYDIFFKKISMKNISLNYSLSINIWRKTIPLKSGQKVNNNIYNEFINMIQDFDGEVTCKQVKAKAIDLENLIYENAILFEFKSERNRCMSILFSCEKFGRNLNLVILTMFTPEKDLSPKDMKTYALAISKNIYVESFRESILQAIDEVLKEKTEVYEDISENNNKNIFE